MFFPSRSHAGPDRYVPVRAAAFVVGTACVLVGAVTERRWIVWVGMGVLGVAIVIRLLARRHGGAEPPEPPEHGD